MDPLRFSLIAHGDLPCWNPLAMGTFDEVLAAAELPTRARVLDVGCGPGTLLLRVLRGRPGATGLGVDRAGPAVARARAAAAAGGCADRAEFREETFDPARLHTAHHDLVLCIGASHAVGTTAEALGVLAPLVAPGGALVLGDGFWEREPDPEYLALLGGTREDLRTFGATATLGKAAGLEPVAARAVAREDWDRYEGTYAANVERFAAANPADPDVPAMLARIRPWRDGYLRWGRSTMGFGLFLFRRRA